MVPDVRNIKQLVQVMQPQIIVQLLDKENATLMLNASVFLIARLLLEQDYPILFVQLMIQVVWQMLTEQLVKKN